MDVLLLHGLALLWMSVGAARRLTAGPADRLLAAGLLAWGNIVATGLLLAALHRLGSPGWFFGTSMVLAILLCGLVTRLAPAGPVTGRGPAIAATFIALLVLGVGLWQLAVGARFGHADLAHRLPRVLYYVGQGSLGHFETGDPRQVWLPFNSTLLALLPALYHAPLATISLFNQPAWSAAALLCVPLFCVQWGRTRLKRHAWLAGLAAGLAAGSELGWLLLVAVAGALASLVALFRRGEPGSLRAWLGAGLLAGLLAVPFALVNVASAGRLTPPAHPLPWFSAPLLARHIAPPALPPALPHRLAPRTRINVDSDADDEEILPLLSLAPAQRFAARHPVDPERYHLFSRSRAARGVIALPAPGAVFSVLVPLPAKRTAGIEWLGTLGSGGTARDYFGLEPGAGRSAPVDGNRNVLVTLQTIDPATGDFARVRLRFAGLNPADQVQLAVSADYADWSSAPLATVVADGEIELAIARPLRWLTLRALDPNPGAPLDPVEIPAVVADGGTLQPVALQRSNDQSLFVTELVARRHDTGLVAGTGLLPTEGPHPPQELPYVRWAGQASVRLVIPALPGLTRLQVAFSLRPQSREHAALDLLLNGRRVQHYPLDGRDRWRDETVELVLAPGENVLEFRDVTRRSGPDWLDYLGRYPDVKAYVMAQGIPPEQGAREHYERHGRAEHRTVQPLPPETPDVPPESRYFLFRQIRLEGFKSP